MEVGDGCGVAVGPGVLGWPASGGADVDPPTSGTRRLLEPTEPVPPPPPPPHEKSRVSSSIDSKARRDKKWGMRSNLILKS